MPYRPIFEPPDFAQICHIVIYKYMNAENYIWFKPMSIAMSDELTNKSWNVKTIV